MKRVADQRFSSDKNAEKLFSDHRYDFHRVYRVFRRKYRLSFLCHWIFLLCKFTLFLSTVSYDEFDNGNPFLFLFRSQEKIMFLKNTVSE